jgi:hypothetical protein
MNRNPVTSSNIRSIGLEDGAMEIEFTNGRVYRYTGPKVADHHEQLINAPSIGKHFAAHVRNCPHTKVDLVGA